MNLRHQGPGPDGMNGPGRDEKQVIPVNGDLLQVFHDVSRFDRPAQHFSGAVLPEAIDEARSRLGIQNVPHLCFSQLSILMESGIVVGGMHLNGQILLCIDELNEKRQLLLPSVAKAQVLRMDLQHLRQGFPIKVAA